MWMIRQVFPGEYLVFQSRYYTESSQLALKLWTNPAAPMQLSSQENKKARRVFSGGENPSWLQISGLHYSQGTVIPRGAAACAQHPAFSTVHSGVF